MKCDGFDSVFVIRMCHSLLMNYLLVFEKTFSIQYDIPKNTANVIVKTQASQLGWIMMCNMSENRFRGLFIISQELYRKKRPR